MIGWNVFRISWMTITTFSVAMVVEDYDSTSSYPVCLAWDDDSNNSCRLAHSSVECGVYMAPSTLGEANMGIYTGKDMKLGEVVNFPEIAIPLQFREWGDHGDTSTDGVLWDRYIWDHGVADTEPTKSNLERTDGGAVFVPGVGCTVNSRLELANIASTSGSTYDTTGLHRSRSDPGVGAFSPYHGSKTVMNRDTSAGSELFASYGDTWIPNIPGAIVTFDETMDLADDFLLEYYDAVEEIDGLSDELAEAVWNLTRSFGNGGDILMENFVLGAVPREASWKDVKRHLEESRAASESLQRDEQINRKGTLSTSRKFVDDMGRRSSEWLQQHGKCQDHLKPGRSTLPQAGRGAFATRFLPDGTVVGFSPLVHFGRDGRLVLNVNEFYKEDDDDNKRDDLILNYSFGHSESTLLLTPYGSMVNYINHSRENANVGIRFPETELVAHKPDWLKESPSEFLANIHEKIGLAFDYVALRDIQPDEEVFLDYGDEWIQAWEEHVQNWKPIAGEYVHRSEWTETQLRTEEELKSDPYPSNLITLCTVSYQRREEDNVNLWIPLLRTTDKRKYCDVLERYAQPGKEEGDESYLYTVRIYMKNEEEEKGEEEEDNNDQEEKATDDEEEEEPIVIVRDVPSPTGIELLDKIHSADFHLPQAFRHYIQIPDNILPDAWKNKEN